MTDQPVILLTKADGIATLTLNRPAVHNAFDEETIASITAALRDAGADASVRAVVLRAQGKSFCAGGDLNWMRRAAGYTSAENEADAQLLGVMLNTLYTLPKPTIAMVHGAVYGGGVGVVAACDIALGLPDSKFCLSEVKIGLVPSVISPYVLQAIGARAARRLFLTAEVFSAERAQQLGLLHDVCADEAAREDQLAYILKHIQRNAPDAMHVAKELIYEMVGKPIDTDVVRRSAELIARRRATAEAKEGITAFLEKRQPNWVQPKGDA